MGDYASFRLTGLGINLLASTGQYVSLLYGITSVIKDDPEITKVIIAGISFTGSSGLNYIGDLYNTKAVSDEINDKIIEFQTEIKRKTKLFKSSEENRLDQIVRAETEKELKKD